MHIAALPITWPSGVMFLPLFEACSHWTQLLNVHQRKDPRLWSSPPSNLHVGCSSESLSTHSYSLEWASRHHSLMDILLCWKMSKFDMSFKIHLSAVSQNEEHLKARIKGPPCQNAVSRFPVHTINNNIDHQPKCFGWCFCLRD